MSRPGVPDFFIVGAPKCGTTSMARWLTAHPELFVLRGEPHYFGSDIAYNRPRLSERAYRALWRGLDGDLRVGDRSTWSLFSRKAAAEIHACNPDARIIAMLRDPAEMIHSLHAHHLQRGGREDCADLAEALALEPARRAGHRIPPAARFVESLYYSRIPRYAEQLDRYIERFGRERVHVVVFDDLAADPSTVYRRTLAFLGVDPTFRTDLGIHNPGGPAPSDWLHRWWKRTPLRYRLRSLAPEPLYRWLRAHHRPGWRRLEQAPPRAALGDAVRQSIDRALLDEVRRLEARLGRELPGWAQSARDAGSDALREAARG